MNAQNAEVKLRGTQSVFGLANHRMTQPILRFSLKPNNQESIDGKSRRLHFQLHSMARNNGFSGSYVQNHERAFYVWMEPMTPTEKRDLEDRKFADAIAVSALSFLSCIQRAQERGLHVNANAGTRYTGTILAGNVDVHRVFKNNGAKKVMCKVLKYEN